jgi:hypothetical protein
MNNELEMWKEAVKAQMKVLSWYLPGVTEESHENLISGPRFKPKPHKYKVYTNFIKPV